ncbi:MAG: phage protease, partial [Rhodospirillales bacterium]|nr:phage protease [Rhodospirillales bacterium]
WRAVEFEAIIAASLSYAGQTEIVVDYEHQTDQSPKNGQAAPAAGWIKGFAARTDGLYGLVEWTSRARAYLAAREYRYLSPVFNHTPDGRITRLLRAALTNAPALELTALARAEESMDELKELRRLIGLPEDADLAVITAKVAELLSVKATAVPDPSQYVPIADFERVTKELNARDQGVALAKAETVVDQAIGRGHLPPYLKDWAVSLCTVNKPAFDAFVDRTAPAMARLFDVIVHGNPPAGDRAAGLDESQAAVCNALGHSPEDFAKNLKG